MSSVMQEFTKGLWKDLPPFRLVLGLCPTLAVTNSTLARPNILVIGPLSTFTACIRPYGITNNRRNHKPCVR